jgi:hypothetical protein
MHWWRAGTGDILLKLHELAFVFSFVLFAFSLCSAVLHDDRKASAESTMCVPAVGLCSKRCQCEASFVVIRRLDHLDGPAGLGATCRMHSMLVESTLPCIYEEVVIDASLNLSFQVPICISRSRSSAHMA